MASRSERVDGADRRRWQPRTLSPRPSRLPRLALAAVLAGLVAGAAQAAGAVPGPTTAPRAGSETGSATGACATDSSILCLELTPGDRRFQVQGIFQTAQGGGGGQRGAMTTVPLTANGITDSGLLAFFGAANPQVLVKIVDGCSITSYYWLFVAAATNSGYSIHVTDTVTGESIAFQNPDENPAQPVQDLVALPCSP